MATNNITNPLKVKGNNPLSNFSDPKKTGITALILAFVSLFIFGEGLSLIAIIMGVFGIWNAIKLKAGTGAVLMNIGAIILGLASKILLAVFVK